MEIEKFIYCENRLYKKSAFKYLMHKILLIFFSLIIPLFLISCGGNEDKSGNEVNNGTPVTITHPQLMNLKATLELNGNTVFLNKEIIRSTFDGFIEKEFKNIGDNVKPGDNLFQIKTKESAANDTLKINLGNQTFHGVVYIKANSNGVLSELNYHAGDYVTTGEQIAIVSNPSSLRIKLNVPYEDVLKVKIGKECEINLPDGVIIPGIIEKNVPAVDPVTQTQIFYIKLNYYRDIPESLNVMVKIPYENFKNATVLPKSSLITNVTEDSFWIMKLVNDTTAIRVDVTKGIENDSVAQIISPKLDTTEKIILTGAYGLPDTAKVEIIK